MIKLERPRLALGTAQFGSSYGIANKGTLIDKCEADKILTTACSLGIDTIDTAKMYKNAEQILGSYSMSKFKIITKIPSSPKNVTPREWLLSQFNDSLMKLKLPFLYGLLFHSSASLLSENGPSLTRVARELKTAGLLGKVGVTVYSPYELDELYSKFKFDIVQLPLNIFDRRFEKSGWLKRLHNDGVEIHVRSIFLQGLLLLSLDEIPTKFIRWKPHFETYHSLLSSKKIKPIEACLSYPLGIQEIDKIVVGVDSSENLIEIFNYTQKKYFNEETSFLQINDERLINPTFWNML